MCIVNTIPLHVWQLRSRRIETIYDFATISSGSSVSSDRTPLAVPPELKADRRTRDKPDVHDEPRVGEFDCMVSGEVD